MKREGYAFVVRCVIDPAQREHVVELLNAHAAAALHEEPQTLRFDVAIDEQHPAVVYLYETYANEAAFEAHFTSMRARPQPWVKYYSAPPERLCIGSIVANARAGR